MNTPPSSGRQSKDSALKYIIPTTPADKITKPTQGDTQPPSQQWIKAAAPTDRDATPVQNNTPPPSQLHLKPPSAKVNQPVRQTGEHEQNGKLKRKADSELVAVESRSKRSKLGCETEQTTQAFTLGNYSNDDVFDDIPAALILAHYDYELPTPPEIDDWHAQDEFCILHLADCERGHCYARRRLGSPEPRAGCGTPEVGRITRCKNVRKGRARKWRIAKLAFVKELARGGYGL